MARVEGLLSLLAQRRAQQQQLEEQQRQREWKEGQMWPQFGRRLLGAGLGGLMQLGTDRLGEAWLPSKIAEADKHKAQTALAKLEADKAQAALDETQFQKDVRSRMAGIKPEYKVRQEDFEAARAGLQDQAALQVTRSLSPDQILGPPTSEAFIEHVMEQAYEQQKQRGFAEARAATPRTPTEHQRRVEAVAKKQMGREEFEKQIKAAETAARLGQTRPFRQHRGRVSGTEFDPGDFTTYLEAKIPRGKRARGRRRLMSFDSKEMKGAYDTVWPEADKILKNEGRVAAVDYINRVGGPKFAKHREGYVSVAARHLSKVTLKKVDQEVAIMKLEAKAKGAAKDRELKEKRLEQDAANNAAKIELANRKLNMEAVTASEKIEIRKDLARLKAAQVKNQSDLTAATIRSKQLNDDLKERRLELDVTKAQQGKIVSSLSELGLGTTVTTEGISPEAARRILTPGTPPPATTPPSTPVDPVAAEAEKINKLHGPDSPKPLPKEERKRLLKNKFPNIK